ncbi:28S ribosomal protein S10 [Sarcoptes scabiei]|uniref:Small ribosomal subunit protein uS10m n=1 Tax=Sarcoptes scabiei TaxID=52283 RepID=A0A132A764_SARSC|nr:28S ribosomal protein S10 [Sarcoptes scabiei]KPM06811.1 28S ribosomal protein S10, mitochondrial-like protein [Sarcoptes scabiei]UXI16723.1 uncharacterized protein NH340_JMT02666 [Sarcoptes scabiei]
MNFRFIPFVNRFVNSNLNLLSKNHEQCALLNSNKNFAIDLISKRFLANKTIRSDTKATKLTDPSIQNEYKGDVKAEKDILYKDIQLEARSADRALLDSYEKFVLMSANFLDINVSKVWEPYRSIKRRTLLRAAFVKKKYRVQYEFRTYFRSIELKHLTGSTADTFLEYVERNLPEGAALKVRRRRLDKIPSHLTPPSSQP